ncbi:helix-turn-helix transcriptional regulator [Variovorax sp. CAN2819]|uniref:helix-turn-helix domain-containing protein n=1 Tax=Variovorax sp. CAN15 TaxID=3046727 RepID=UPI0026478DA8|nr:helix-turn-helix transcriptional regulator [Variovorax sp. CAN15]MDN6885317.1 helix-turn-helix transcriptional regulator [Variovorax sp. CAN15]
MNPIKAIREWLGVTQAELAKGIGCSQSNIAAYEKGQTVPPPNAKALIVYAESRGRSITFDHIYGNADLPVLPTDATPKAA